MNDRILLGAVAPVLEKNGYIPSSVSSPGKRGLRYADDEAAIALIMDASSGFEDHKQRRVVALIVGTRNAKARADVLAALKRFKLDGAPCRAASDGSLAFVLRHENSYGTIHTRASERAPGEREPAVILLGEERLSPRGEASAPNILRVGGTWNDERSPLTVKRQELPELSDEDALFNAFDAVFGITRAAPEERIGWGTQLPERPTPTTEKLRGVPHGLTAAERAPFEVGARGRGRSHRDQFVIPDND